MAYQFTTRQNGKPSAGLSVLLAPTGMPLRPRERRQGEMGRASKFSRRTSNMTVPIISRQSLRRDQEGHNDALEAMALVFLVTFVFLQNLRYTIIPAVVVPRVAHRRLHRAFGVRLFHQFADAVCDGARHRHSRR